MDNQRILKLLIYILAGITFICLCLTLLAKIVEHDFFWHLATGRWIVENMSLPSHDPFSYTTPALLSSREYFILTSYWLSQILYYGIYYVSGWNGFIILRFIILGAIIYFVYKRAAGSDRTILYSVAAITSIAFVQGYAFERPQAFSFLFFAILLYLLEKLKEASSEQRAAFSVKEGKSVHATRYTLLPLLMLFWANMHGGYIVGQGVILVYLLSEGLKFLHPSLRPMERSSYQRFLITGIAGMLSALINPNTYKAITETWNISEFSSMKYIAEHWSTITFFRVFYVFDIPIYWLLLLIASVSLLFRIIRKRYDVQDVVMLAGLGYFSFAHVRYIAFFLIWAAPFIAVSLTRIMEGYETAPSTYDGSTVQRPLWKYIIIFASFVIVVFMTGPKGVADIKNIANFKGGQWISDDYPAEAVDFIIKNDIKGNMFNYYDWGGYLIWRFYPQKKVFIDGRNLYELQYSHWLYIINAALEPEVMGTPYYKALLESYKVGYMLMPFFTLGGEMPPVVREMIRDREWVAVFLSGNSMIFVKDTPENHDLIKRCAMPKDMFVEKLFGILEEKIKQSPTDFSLYLTRGDLYYSRWRFKEAGEDYRRVLEINPFNSNAKERLDLLKEYTL